MNFEEYMSEAAPGSHQSKIFKDLEKDHRPLRKLVAHHQSEEQRHATLYKKTSEAKNPDSSHHHFMQMTHQNIHKDLQSAMDNMHRAAEYKAKNHSVGS